MANRQPLAFGCKLPTIDNCLRYPLASDRQPADDCWKLKMAVFVCPLLLFFALKCFFRAFWALNGVVPFGDCKVMDHDVGVFWHDVKSSQWETVEGP